jgi:hypothetical protein
MFKHLSIHRRQAPRRASDRTTRPTRDPMPRLRWYR